MLRVLVTGGGGYVGTVLIPKLLDRGARVTCLDWLLFGDRPLAGFMGLPGFQLVRGDIRDGDRVRECFEQTRPDVVVHLAAISNDPSSDLDPDITRSINRDALQAVIQIAKQTRTRRFIYASSASVYGVKDVPRVSEDLPLEPLTLYAQYKAEGEDMLRAALGDGFGGIAIRAATVCGYSPRLRLDLTINILTEHAVRRGRIRVLGGTQKRPNIHLQDLTDLYVMLATEAPDAIMDGRAYNVSHSNASVVSLAEMIRTEIDPALPIEVEPTNDSRSYTLDASAIARDLGFVPRHELVEAVREVHDALTDGRVPDADSSWYRNVAFMREHPELWKGPTPS
jgi:nucleoside-diphosphate-sugar epimerase